MARIDTDESIGFVVRIGDWSLPAILLVFLSASDCLGLSQEVTKLGIVDFHAVIEIEADLLISCVFQFLFERK